MRKLKIIIASAIAAVALVAVAAPIVATVPGAMHNLTQTEVLVLNSAATSVPATALSGRKALEIYNNGPNAIYCSGGTPVVNKAREIAPDSSWYVEVGETVDMKCIAASADQLTTAATIVSEIK